MSPTFPAPASSLPQIKVPPCTAVEVLPLFADCFQACTLLLPHVSTHALKLAMQETNTTVQFLGADGPFRIVFYGTIDPRATDVPILSVVKPVSGEWMLENFNEANFTRI